MTFAHPLTRIFLFTLLVVEVVRADPAPASLFTDGAVLQRERPIPIWGKADAGEKIVVTFAGQKREVITGPDGRWRVMLEPLPASATGAELIIAGNKTTTLRDILIGEVWLCSGQSNMAFTVNRAKEAAKEIAGARFPSVRHVTIERALALFPNETVKTSGWQAATPENVGEFTAVGYFFARDIHQKLDVPVGIIHSSWGGTPVEAWMNGPALASDPAFRVVSERWQESLARDPARQEAYDEWTRQDEAAKAQGAGAQAAFRQQNPPPTAPRQGQTPAGLYNGMIHPAVPYALRGVLWYQGENNTTRASEYRALFSAMITGWRAAFEQGELPFFWVNLAGFQAPDPSGRNYAFLREAQTQTLALPNTAQAVAIDLGEAKDIHPKNKQDVGRRLALLAKRRLYGIPCDDTGPTYASMTREGSAVRVRFNFASGGLVAHNSPPGALELAGSDKVFHPARGRIDRTTLVVSSPAVPEPVAVRYAWQNFPLANLYSGAGLPVVPFRSDDW
ncbi:MAG: hypothetical protein RIQ93_1210 [Verrucomicrobiota bacterium]|jgi:sialate O-acetylesterase